MKLKTEVPLPYTGREVVLGYDVREKQVVREVQKR